MPGYPGNKLNGFIEENINEAETNDTKSSDDTSTKSKDDKKKETAILEETDEAKKAGSTVEEHERQKMMSKVAQAMSSSDQDELGREDWKQYQLSEKYLREHPASFVNTKGKWSILQTEVLLIIYACYYFVVEISLVFGRLRIGFGRF